MYVLGEKWILRLRDSQDHSIWPLNPKGPQNFGKFLDSKLTATAAHSPCMSSVFCEKVHTNHSTGPWTSEAQAVGPPEDWGGTVLSPHLALWVYFWGSSEPPLCPQHPCLPEQHLTLNSDSRHLRNSSPALGTQTNIVCWSDLDLVS